MEAGAALALVIVVVVAAFIPPFIAANKGYSFAGFFVAGLVAWPAALIVALVLPDKSRGVVVGSTIKVRSSVQLDGGAARIPVGHCSQVQGVDVIDGVPVVQVTAPDGSLRWIARKSVAHI